MLARARRRGRARGSAPAGRPPPPSSSTVLPAWITSATSTDERSRPAVGPALVARLPSMKHVWRHPSGCPTDLAARSGGFPRALGDRRGDHGGVPPRRGPPRGRGRDQARRRASPGRGACPPRTATSIALRVPWADLEPGPAVCRAPGRLWTGVSCRPRVPPRPPRPTLRRRPDPARVGVSRSVLEHLLAIRECGPRSRLGPPSRLGIRRAVQAGSRPAPPPRREPSPTSSSPFPRDSGIAVALESKDARARAPPSSPCSGQRALCDWDNLRDNLPRRRRRHASSASAVRPRARDSARRSAATSTTRASRSPRRPQRPPSRTSARRPPRPETSSPRFRDFRAPPTSATTPSTASRPSSTRAAPPPSPPRAAACAIAWTRTPRVSRFVSTRTNARVWRGCAAADVPVGSASNPPIVDPRDGRDRSARGTSARRIGSTRSRASCAPVAPPSYPDAPGGLLCDEPGLGKTVTALALTLARRICARASSPGFARARARRPGDGTIARPRLGDGDGDAAAGAGRHPGRHLRRGSVHPGGRRRNGGGVAVAVEHARGTSIPRHGTRGVRVHQSLRETEEEQRVVRARQRGGQERRFSPAAPSRLGPRFAEAPTSADEEKKIKIEWSANANEPGPPKGFRPLRASAARAATGARRRSATSRTSRRRWRPLDARVGSSAVEEDVRVRTHESRRRRPDHRRRPAPVAEVEVQRRPRREGVGGAVRPRTRAVRGRTHAEGLGVGSPGEKRVGGDASRPATTRTTTRTTTPTSRSPSTPNRSTRLSLSTAEAASRAPRCGCPAPRSSCCRPTLISHGWNRSAPRGTRADGPSVCVVGAVDAKRDDAAGSFAIDGEDADADRWLFGVEGETRDGSRSERADGEASASSSASAWTEGGCSKSTRARQRHDALPSFDGLSPRVLASRWDVVLIPVNRLSAEFSRVDSPLLRVHWQRVVLDEGHQLGGASAITAKLSVASRSGRTPDG